MKIILVNRYFLPDQSATSRVISSLADALTRNGFEIVALTSRTLHNQKNVSLPAEEMVGDVTVKRLGTSHFGRHNIVGRAFDYLSFHVLAFFWLLRHVSRGDVCIVCTDPPLLSVTCALPIRLRGARMVNWIMDLFPEVAMELGMLKAASVGGRLAIWLRNWSLKSSALVVCPTRTMADYIRELGIPRDRLVVLPHWSDEKEIYPVPREKNGLREQWGLADTFVVGYSGNFGRAHEFGTLIEAATRLKDRDDIRFLMIGAGQQHAPVQAEVSARGLGNVIFKPLQPAEQLAESLSAADVHIVSLLPHLEHCIIPSKFYGIMAAGRPTLFIGDKMGEVARVIAETSCGQAVTIGDSEGLVSTISALQEAPDRCMEMGRIARQVLETEYAREKAIASWCALIARLDRHAASVARNALQRQS
ncbi:glycosyltransferase family 4 protein [Rhizobium sp. BK251]|uniref:glycosyltransferase family 4 protein n=1 Tax=Rhizobium sp. BK251 TaxID=2512125 RepID=UPI0010D43986|nr:glycosyltransferase family 4 protein [Rhizobium sp. BK251]TCL74548.1 glycosyltransferase involved in cell wall biosynthesis [Rhizobium sp. BK251]